ncbi:MAG: orotidine-5'-phosphate decarboxylase [Gammaproteobacteria bacterium]|nr:orotidine-5'-phosphate decarboxylase [Gammaproteobacteria bacterium]MBU1654634.1 orotidine-5'-phosphate decarboxylase [Gammaproteobacteria bacterium]MBU1962010.1 orotidine-5'-phosphate decarboxylase [Gammaproteobacteria bacterium]
MNSHLSTKLIPPNERLIFALDVPSADEAKELIGKLGDSVVFYKLGLELFMAGGYFELVQYLVDMEKKVMVDLKFFDVPETVNRAVQRLVSHRATFATVHGNDTMLEAAVKGAGDGLKILAVTVLTSLDESDLRELGFKCTVEELVLSRAKRALDIGCAGVVSSGIEARSLRDSLGAQFMIVTPGIRPVANIDDQKRTVDIEEAFHNGADYIVVGRPIRDAEDPFEAALAIQRRISNLFPAT